MLSYIWYFPIGSRAHHTKCIKNMPGIKHAQFRNLAPKVGQLSIFVWAPLGWGAIKNWHQALLPQFCQDIFFVYIFLDLFFFVFVAAGAGCTLTLLQLSHGNIFSAAVILAQFVCVRPHCLCLLLSSLFVFPFLPNFSWLFLCTFYLWLVQQNISASSGKPECRVWGRDRGQKLCGSHFSFRFRFFFGSSVEWINHWTPRGIGGVFAGKWVETSLVMFDNIL